MLITIVRLKYVKSAKADTDVPKSVSTSSKLGLITSRLTIPLQVAEFISQRRRWLNGSFFVSVYATFWFWRIWKSGHPWWRKILLQESYVA